MVEFYQPPDASGEPGAQPPEDACRLLADVYMVCDMPQRSVAWRSRLPSGPAAPGEAADLPITRR